jgi:hypothetical protein
MSYGVIMTNYTIMDYKKYIYSLGTALSGARGRHRRGRCKVIGSPRLASRPPVSHWKWGRHAYGTAIAISTLGQGSEILVVPARSSDRRLILRNNWIDRMHSAER